MGKSLKGWSRSDKSRRKETSQGMFFNVMYVVVDGMLSVKDGRLMWGSSK